MLSLPTIAGQAVDPFAQLMETAYIGRLGPVELASAGVSISIFNIISKLFNMPLVSVATSFVAEDLSKNAVVSPTGGGFLLGRTLALLTTTTQATSLAACQGPLAMAADQICLQVWLAASLLTDVLAVSAQQYGNQAYQFCDVCSELDSLPSSRMIKGSFWGQIYCKRRERDMTPRCFICHRFKTCSTQKYGS
ncbi:unnamed protein product [Ilex paraguariensis]|uniref:Uncharacterized protein n=1 Tax=Ilex paraguariensis TaxID=185542 RepID=A0ABC8RIQ1_9AQUA